MLTGFLGWREHLLRIEIACERIRDHLESARRLETNGHVAMAQAARESAAAEPKKRAAREDPARVRG